MAKRTICIQNPAKLSISHSALCIHQKDVIVARIPLEDIWVLILETPQITITSAALSSLAESGIGTMTCGENHLPNGLLLPIGAHSRHSAIVKNQLLMSKPLIKQLWQHIVKHKIINQAKTLKLLGIKSDHILKLASEIKSGDSTNRESVAAGAYFKLLIKEGNRRKGPYTAALDYGYGVLRAGIGREAVSKGWLVSQGIHHNSELNAFNLIDDLIEPFRPIVDLLVVQESLTGELDPSTKAKLASIFEIKVECDGRQVSIQHAIEKELDSLRTAVEQANAKLLVLPKILDISYVTQE